MDDFKPEFEVKTTAENLQAAINGESYEETNIYVKFMEDAKAKKVEKAITSFSWASYTEEKHLDFYRKAPEALNAAKESTLPSSYAVCPVCGNTYDSANMDEKCALCQTGKEIFIFI